MDSWRGLPFQQISLPWTYWQSWIFKKAFLVFGGFMPTSSRDSRLIRDSQTEPFRNLHCKSHVLTPAILHSRIAVKAKQERKVEVWPGYWAEVEATNKETSSSVSLFQLSQKLSPLKLCPCFHLNTTFRVVRFFKSTTWIPCALQLISHAWTNPATPKRQFSWKNT